MKRLIGLLVFGVTLAGGQTPEVFPWWDRPIVRNLDLSPEQQRQIRETVRECRDRLIELRANVQKAEAGLQDQMNEDRVDETKANEAVERVVATRGDLLRAVSRMTVRLRAVLTPEQWQRLRRRLAEQRQPLRRGPAGRGRFAPSPPEPDL